jgi:hypothetical protein
VSREGQGWKSGGGGKEADDVAIPDADHVQLKYGCGLLKADGLKPKAGDVLLMWELS